MWPELDALMQDSETGASLRNDLFLDMDSRQEAWYNAIATSAAESRKRKYENGDDEVVGVPCAGDLGKRRKSPGATPIRDGTLHRAVKEFYAVANKFYGSKGKEAGGVDEDDIDVDEDCEELNGEERAGPLQGTMEDTPAISLANERGFGQISVDEVDENTGGSHAGHPSDAYIHTFMWVSLNTHTRTHAHTHARTHTRTHTHTHTARRRRPRCCHLFGGSDSV